jgi:hypothetical protein
VSDANDVIFVLPPAILMEATRVNLSFSQTSMVPNFVPANMKSLLMATRWTSSPVDSDPTTILEESENILYQLKEKVSSAREYALEQNKNRHIPFLRLHQ